MVSPDKKVAFAESRPFTLSYSEKSKDWIEKPKDWTEKSKDKIEKPKDGEEFISPDGRQIFDSPFTAGTQEMVSLTEKPAAEIIVPDAYIKNVFAREFDTIYRTRESLAQNGYMNNKNVKNTFHSRLKSKKRN